MFSIVCCFVSIINLWKRLFRWSQKVGTKIKIVRPRRVELKYLASRTNKRPKGPLYLGRNLEQDITFVELISMCLSCSYFLKCKFVRVVRLKLGQDNSWKSIVARPVLASYAQMNTTCALLQFCRRRFPFEDLPADTVTLIFSERAQLLGKRTFICFEHFAAMCYTLWNFLTNYAPRYAFTRLYFIQYTNEIRKARRGAQSKYSAGINFQLFN